MTSGSSVDEVDEGEDDENRSIDVLVDEDGETGTQLIAYSVFEQVNITGPCFFFIVAVCFCLFFLARM